MAISNPFRAHRVTVDGETPNISATSRRERNRSSSRASLIHAPFDRNARYQRFELSRGVVCRAPDEKTVIGVKRCRDRGHTTLFGLQPRLLMKPRGADENFVAIAAGVAVITSARVGRYCGNRSGDRQGEIGLPSREPFTGIGKPEPLKYLASGTWSRRLTQEHRIVHLVSGERIDFLQARYHY